MTILLQRPLRGSRISSFYPVKKLPSLASLNSAFQLQEYISLLIRLDVHDVETIVSLPGRPSDKDKQLDSSEEATEDPKSDDKESPDKDRKNDVPVDEACWIYEQLRRLAQDLSHPLITMLQQECTRNTCPEMKAGEWLYLCVAHGNEGTMEQCCAIDYILHTLDSATALLNSPRAFPSRLQIPQSSHRHFPSLARRLGRIFAHAYFHHRETFEQAEAESSLHARFLALTSKFDLVPSEFLVIPPRVTGHEETKDVELPRILGPAVETPAEREAQPRDLALGKSNLEQSIKTVEEDRAKSRSPPGLGNDSPRRFGRNRTDTMIHSEVASTVEELSRLDEWVPKPAEETASGAAESHEKEEVTASGEEGDASEETPESEEQPRTLTASPTLEEAVPSAAESEKLGETAVDEVKEVATAVATEDTTPSGEQDHQTQHEADNGALEETAATESSSDDTESTPAVDMKLQEEADESIAEKESVVETPSSPTAQAQVDAPLADASVDIPQPEVTGENEESPIDGSMTLSTQDEKAADSVNEIADTSEQEITDILEADEEEEEAVLVSPELIPLPSDDLEGELVEESDASGMAGEADDEEEKAVEAIPMVASDDDEKQATDA